MTSFPRIRDLPSVVDTAGWDWTQLDDPWKGGGDIWVGVDHRGDRWLLKLRGSFYAYREIVFARIAQTLGWSHQSSVFALVPEDATPRLDRREQHRSERTQAVSWFLPEHVEPCGPKCPLGALRSKLSSKPDDQLGAYFGSGITHATDIARGDIAAHIFRCNDGPDRLLTTAHELVLIDAEMMFSNGLQCRLPTNHWWNNSDGSPSEAGNAFILGVCKEIGALSDTDLDLSLAIPEGIEVAALWDIREIVFAGRDYARAMILGMR